MRSVLEMEAGAILVLGQGIPPGLEGKLEAPLRPGGVRASTEGLGDWEGPL